MYLNNGFFPKEIWDFNPSIGLINGLTWQMGYKIHYYLLCILRGLIKNFKTKIHKNRPISLMFLTKIK